MSRVLFAAVIALCLDALGARAELPPLIPRKVLFGNPVKTAAQISPDAAASVCVRRTLAFVRRGGSFARGTYEPWCDSRHLTNSLSRASTVSIT